ncbi:MAG: S8 family serine peptidase [Cyanobacteria bacterium J06638_22]
MKRLVQQISTRLASSVMVSGCLAGAIALLPTAITFSSIAHAQMADTQPTDDLYYTFYGRQIPLRSRPDIVAVQFRPTSGSRSRGALPQYLQLQDDLQTGMSSGTRGDGRLEEPAEGIEVNVEPLGDRFALVTPTDAGRSTDDIRQRVQDQNYVEDTLPVLSLSGVSDDAAEMTVVLPNEIVVGFESELSNSEIQYLLYRYDLEVIRPLQFTENRYLVRSLRENGIGVLHTANRLAQEIGIQSAAPNFVQSVSYQVQDARFADAGTVPDANERLLDELAALPTLDTPFDSNLLPLAWHLNSTPQRGILQTRTDVRATEAWERSNGGEDVVVAVIDSLIQWDHPNLAQSIYTVPESTPNLLPGEVHGWDFTNYQVLCTAQDICVSGDPDTRISQEELAVLRPAFQETFALSDSEILSLYESYVGWFLAENPSLTDAELARMMRNIIRSEISAEFHGTWSAGVIASQPADAQGVVGVAPNAEILPVRVFGLGGEITPSRLIEAVGYAAERDVDVINMSLGSMWPHQDLVDQVFNVLDENPDLVIVASAGNDNLDGVGFPAATPGVISVGATNLEGRRTFYSSYGGRLDVVAPGGETTLFNRGGILTTGGTWVDGFWDGMEIPSYSWDVSLDPMGYYVQVQGTSFSAPTVAGVVALMRGVNPGMDRDRITTILQDTASYDGLSLSAGDRNRYRLQREVGMTLMEDRLSGVFPLPDPVSAEEYFFGHGLVNAEAAVNAAR